jgi:hypothetical protein
MCGSRGPRGRDRMIGVQLPVQSVPLITNDRLVVFSGYSGFSSTNKTDHHDITEILLTVVLNT